MHLLLTVVATAIAVHGTDTTLTLSPAKVTAQAVTTFTVTNAGSKKHVFGVAGKQFTVAPHRVRIVRVQLDVGRVPLTWSGARPKILTVEPVPVSRPVTGTSVDVGMVEYGYTLSEQSVPTGPVTFHLHNDGRLPHDFSIQGVARSQTLAPGGTTALTVTLSPGTYTYVCTILGHAEQGMTGTLTVT